MTVEVSPTGHAYAKGQLNSIMLNWNWGCARFLLPNTRPHPILRPLFQETDYASDNRTESDTQHRDHGAH